MVMMATESESEIDAVALVPETPYTPQPQNIALPSKTDMPRAISPSVSIMAGSTSSPSMRGTSLMEPKRERSKYSSPPPQSSMTPPPSSQAPQRHASFSRIERAGTPTPSHLSSPPPTSHNGGIRESSSDDIFARPTDEDIAEASPTGLRDMLKIAVAEMRKLDSDVHEAHMSAAHYKFQYNLLSLETQEAAMRMEVEHEMTRREVEALQMAEHSRQTRRDISSPVQTNSARHLVELKTHCQMLADELAVVCKRLTKAKRLVIEKQDAIHSLTEENIRLRQRIRENRDHVTKLKSPGGLFSGATPRPPTSSFPTTPQQYRHTPRTPATARSHVHQDRAGSQEPFAALLLADRVLSQESRSSAPSSPVPGAQPIYRSGQIRHNRNVQSLSSLPTTPVRSRPAGTTTLLPSIQFPPHSEPRYRSSQSSGKRERRRKSRDSTISASDLEDRANEGFDESEEEIQESQASQSATAMLRRDPKESFEIRGTPTPPIPDSTKRLHQTKIFGAVTKPLSGPDKRKRGLEEHPQGFESPKKVRTENVGLGIGHWPNSPSRS